MIRTQAEREQEEIFRAMSPQQRLRLAGHFYDFAKKVIASQGGEKIYERIRRAARQGRKSA